MTNQTTPSEKRQLLEALAVPILIVAVSLIAVTHIVAVAALVIAGSGAPLQVIGVLDGVGGAALVIYGVANLRGER